MTYKIQKTEEEWRAILTPEQYRVLRGKGTERAFTGEYCSVMEPGIYRCAACDAELFNSETKFNSGTGWPSFWQPVSDSAIEIREDRSHGMVRDEVLCAQCGSHLGHVFNDGPPPTGMRYCLNSVSLRLDKQVDTE
jgi:peptide-methionine (R)-S-oxide reductase